jgi:hypothetical protein
LPISRKSVWVRRESRHQSRAPRNTYEQYCSRARYFHTSIDVMLTEIMTNLKIPHKTSSRGISYMQEGYEISKFKDRLLYNYTLGRPEVSKILCWWALCVFEKNIDPHVLAKINIDSLHDR